MIKILYFILGVLIILLFVPIGMFLEKRNFNDGICIHCGSKLRHFDNDSLRGRGYHCDVCGYVTWVSYNSIDKIYRSKGE